MAFTGWQASLRVEATSSQPSSGCTADSSTSGDSPPSKEGLSPAPAAAAQAQYSTDITIDVAGGIVLGGAVIGDALQFSIAGRVITATQTVEITITHPGGWCPFSFLSFFCTPQIYGFFRMSNDPQAETYLFMEALVNLHAAIPIVPGIVEVTCYAETCSGGPEFGVSMTQSQKTGPRIFSAFFRGKACLKLTSKSYCMLVSVSAVAQSSRRRLDEVSDVQINQGRLAVDLRVKERMINATTSWLDPSPSLVEMPDDLQQTTSAGSNIDAHVDATLPRQLATTKKTSKKKGFQFIGFTIRGQLVSGDLKPISLIPFLSFMEDLLVIRATYDQPLSLSLTILPGAPVSLSLSAVIAINLPSFLGIPSINLPVEGGGQLGGGGPTMAFKTPELPALDLGIFKFTGLRLMIATDTTMITLQSGTQFELMQGFALVYEGASPIPAMCPLSMVLIFQMPSPRSFRFEGLCSGFSLMMLHKSPVKIPSINFLRFDSIRIFAGVEPGLIEFGVGTTFALATGDSYCRDPLEAECIQASFAVWIGVMPGKMIVGFAMPTSGIWIEPVGLRNFAVINPSIEIELEITLSVPPVPTPRKVAFAITILYKMPWLPEWPHEIKYREAPHPAYYTPDLTPWTAGDGSLRQLSFFFLYEQWHPEIDDMLCSITGLPRFAVKVVIPKLSLIQMFLMFADILFSAVSAASQQDVRTPPAVGSLLSVLDEFLKIEMSLYLEFSLIQSEAVPEWSGEPVTRGLYLNTTVYAYFLGFSMDIRCEAKLRIPTPDASGIAKVASGFGKFFSNPMGIMTGEVSVSDLGIEAGLLIEALAKLPLGMGEAYFFGKITFSGFELRAYIDFQVGPFTLDVNLEFIVRLNLVQLEFYANIEFGPFGSVSLYGIITSNPPSYYLNGTLCVNLVGFQFSGFVLTCAGGADCPADGFFAFDIVAYIGFLGTVEMRGQIEASGSGVSVRGSARLELDFAELAVQLVDVVIYIIAGSSNPAASLIGVGLKWLFGLFEFLKVVEIAYDSDAGEISCTLTLNIPFVGGREFGPFLMPLPPLPFRRQRRQLEQLPGWPSSDDKGREATHHRALQSADYCDMKNAMTLKDMVAEVKQYFSNPAKLFASLGPVDFEFEFEVKAFIFGLSGAVRFNMTTEGDITLELEAAMSFLGIGIEGRCKMALDGGIVSGYLLGYGSIPSVCPGCPTLSGKLEAYKYESGVSGINLDVSMSMGCMAVYGMAHFETEGGLQDFLLEVSNPMCFMTMLLEVILGSLGVDVDIQIGVQAVRLFHSGGGSVTFEVELAFFGWTQTMSFTAATPINSATALLELIKTDPTAIMDAFDKFFNLFSLTFLEITLGHPPVDITFAFGFENIAGTGKGLASIGTLKLKNSGFARVGLFGAAFGVDIDDAFYKRFKFVQFDIDLVGAELALKLDATIKNPIAADLANMVGDLLGGLLTAKIISSGTSTEAVEASVVLRDAACNVNSAIVQMTETLDSLLGPLHSPDANEIGSRCVSMLLKVCLEASLA